MSPTGRPKGEYRHAQQEAASVSASLRLAADFAARVLHSRMNALQRRAAQHSGAARQAIEERLIRLSQACALAHQEAAAPPAAKHVSPLAALVAQMARHQAPAGELKTVRDHRGSWVKLGVQQRLSQTLAQVPNNAGPLNTQRLMHQALSLMGAASPAYLQHFMAHVDALLALDQLSPPPAPPPALPTTRPRKDSPRAARSS